MTKAIKTIWLSDEEEFNRIWNEIWERKIDTELWGVEKIRYRVMQGRKKIDTELWER